MAEHESKSQQKQGEEERKRRDARQKSPSLFDQLHTWNNNLLSVTGTPFRPPLDRHAISLSQARSGTQRAGLVMRLQQTYGNRYVQRLVESTGIQAKLTVSAPNDIYEQEADRVAGAVTGSVNTPVQRQAPEEEEIQSKLLLQRQAEEEEEEEIQPKLLLQRQEEDEELAMKPASQLQRKVEEKGKRQIELDTRGVGQEGSQIDLEADPALQRAHGGGQPLAGVVQLMAVLADDDLNAEDDPLVWNNLRFAETTAGGPIGDLKNNKVWDQLTNDKPIRLVAHGEEDKPETSEGVTSQEIFDSMTTGSHTLPLPTDIKIGEVTFQSCYAGKLLVGTDSMVNDMKNLLDAGGYTGVPVKGRTGIAFGFKGMGEKTATTTTGTYKWGTYWFKKEAAKKYYTGKGYDVSTMEDGAKAYYEAMWVYRDKKTRKSPKVKIFPSGPPVYNTPWRLAGIKDADKGLKWDNETPSKRGEMVAEQMQDYWKKVSSFMEKRGGFKPPAEELNIL